MVRKSFSTNRIAHNGMDVPKRVEFSNDWDNNFLFGVFLTQLQDNKVRLSCLPPTCGLAGRGIGPVGGGGREG